MVRACVTGWGIAVPDQRLTNAELERRVNTTDEWIVTRTGIRERRIAGAGETTASLAAAAGAEAIKSAELHPDAIDLVLVATATPEQPIPHTGAFVGDLLGVRCGSLDLNVGCAGWIYGLVAGSSMLVAGGLEHVLVIGAETLSRSVDPNDRATCVIFADGAAAAVLSRAPDDGPGIISWDLGCDGTATSLIEIPAGGSRLPASADTVAQGLHYIKMHGQEVFRRAVRRIVDSCVVALDRAGMTSADVDWFVPHQANLRIIDAAANRLGFTPEQTLVNIERYGNTSAASIPLVLAEAASQNRFEDGQVLLLCGFGAGMSWGSVLIRWGRA